MSKSRLLILCLLITLPQMIPGEGDLCGKLTREQILREHPAWALRAAAYRPDPEAVGRLRDLEFPATIKVFLGTWCPDSARYVSELFKILDEAANPLIRVDYVGLPQDKTKWPRDLPGVESGGLPALIITAGGEERGRVIEHPEFTLEEDLADLLNPPAPQLDMDFFIHNYHADLDVDCTECHLVRGR